MTPQEQYDDAMFDFSGGKYAKAIEKLKSILAEHPDHFDAQLSLGMAYYRLGDYSKAIEEGLKAERMNPREQLVHTNLSLFYMKNGDKEKAEHHGLQARIASWKNPEAPPPNAADSGLSMAEAPRPPVKIPERPWKKTPSSHLPVTPKDNAEGG